MPQAGSRDDDLYVIPGVVPTAAAMPTGRRFHPRCPNAMDRCLAGPIPFADASARAGIGSRARCLRATELTFEGTQ